jgi:hypothetical protein
MEDLPMNNRKNAVVASESTLSKLVAKKITLEDLASNENTSLSRVLAEVDITSNEFIETLSALHCSPMYEHMRAVDPVDVLFARVYLAGRFDERGAPPASARPSPA